MDHSDVGQTETHKSNFPIPELQFTQAEHKFHFSCLGRVVTACKNS